MIYVNILTTLSAASCTECIAEIQKHDYLKGLFLNLEKIVVGKDSVYARTNLEKDHILWQGRW
jgi:hypothetical protein